MRQFELAGTFRHRTGECALAMPEQFAFGHRFRQCCAVDLHQRLLAAARLGVHGARHQFLAGTGLSGDQYGQIGRGHGRDFLAQMAHGPAVADQVAFAAERFLHQIARDGALSFAGLFQGSDQRHVAQRGGSQGGEGADG